MKKLIEIEYIRKHSLYQECYIRLQKAEEGRKFCRHTMEHFIDVARIAWILNLEQDFRIRKPVIYGMALLHDIGKYRQYEEGYPHEKASVEIAKIIFRDLPELSFTEEEKQGILTAIQNHRVQQNVCIDQAKNTNLSDILSWLLYTADKKSRACYSCFAEKECNWTIEKKNMEIEI